MLLGIQLPAHSSFAASKMGPSAKKKKNNTDESKTHNRYRLDKKRSKDWIKARRLVNKNWKRASNGKWAKNGALVVGAGVGVLGLAAVMVSGLSITSVAVVGVQVAVGGAVVGVLAATVNNMTRNVNIGRLSKRLKNDRAEVKETSQSNKTQHKKTDSNGPSNAEENGVVYKSPTYTFGDSGFNPSATFDK